MKEMTINDNDREDFVRNDEGLYCMWRSEMRSEKKLRQFVRNNRSLIDSAIRKATTPEAGTSPAPTNRYGHSMVGRAGQSLMPR